MGSKLSVPLDIYSSRRVRAEKSPLGFWLTVLTLLIPIIVFIVLITQEQPYETYLEINNDLRSTSTLIGASSYYRTKGNGGNGTSSYKFEQEVFLNPLNYSSDSFVESVMINTGAINVSITNVNGTYDKSSYGGQTCIKYRFGSTISSGSYCDWLDCENTSILFQGYDSSTTASGMDCDRPYYNPGYDLIEIKCYDPIPSTTYSLYYDPNLEVPLWQAKECVSRAAKTESSKANLYLNVYTVKRSPYKKAIGPLSYGQLTLNLATVVCAVIISVFLGPVVVSEGGIKTRRVSILKLKSELGGVAHEESAHRASIGNNQPVNLLPLSSLNAPIGDNGEQGNTTAPGKPAEPYPQTSGGP